MLTHFTPAVIASLLVMAGLSRARITTPPPKPDPNAPYHPPPHRARKLTPAFEFPLEHGNSGPSGCEIVGSCIQTRGYDGSTHYQNDASCRFSVGGGSANLDVVDFCTEYNYDVLAFNGVNYSGCASDAASGLDGLAVSTGDSFTWVSDGSVTQRGWKICLVTPRFCDMSDFDDYCRAQHGSQAEAACIFRY